MNPSMDLPIDEVSALMIQSLPKSPTSECWVVDQAFNMSFFWGTVQIQTTIILKYQ
jgi:hypothetical protein